MDEHETLPRFVAILNSNEDLVRLVRETLHDEGYLTMQHHIKDLRDGHTDITRLFEDRNPQVVIYDIAAPFTLDWQFFQVLSRHPTMTNRQVVLTTNNAAALEKICHVQALQVVGSDDDLRELLARVKDAFERVRQSTRGLHAHRA